MKKSKLSLLSLTALLALTGGLAGCSSDASSDSGSSESSSQSTVTISLSEDCPTAIEVGSTVDIAPYVNITPADTSYHLVVKSTTVAILGTEVTGVALGAFEISIVTDDGASSFIYSGTIISNEQVQIASLLESASKTYYALGQVYYLNDYGYYDYGSFTYAYHTDDYFAIPNTYWTNDSSKSYSDIAGVIDIDGYGHEFTYYASSETPTLDISPAKELDTSNYDMADPLPTTGMTDVVASDGRLSYVQLDDEVAADLFLIATGFDLSDVVEAYFGEGYSYGAKISYVESSEALLLSITSGGTDLVRLYLMSLGVADFGLEILDEYASGERELEVLTFDAFSDTIKNIRDNNLSYTTEASVKVGYYYENEWVDATTEMSYLSDQTMTVVDYVSNYWNLDVASFTSYNDSEKRYTVDNGTNAVVAYVPYEGEFYQVSGTTTGTKYSKRSLGSTDSMNISTPIVSALTEESVNTIYNNFAYVTDGMLVGNYSSVTETILGTTATHVNHADEGALFLMICNAFPQIGYHLVETFEGVRSTSSDLPWYEFMSDVTITYNSSDGSIVMEAGINTIDYAVVGEYAYSVNVICSITISDIGSTTVPTEWIDKAFAS